VRRSRFPQTPAFIEWHLLLLSLGPPRQCRFPSFLFALFLCQVFGGPLTALAAQLYSGWVLLFRHEFSITASAGELNDRKVPVRSQNVPFGNNQLSWQMPSAGHNVIPKSALPYKQRLTGPQWGGLMWMLIRPLWSDDQGQDIAEYAVMLAVILVLVVGTIRLVGSNANNVFSQVGSSLNQ